MHLTVGWVQAWTRALRKRRALIFCLIFCLLLFLIWLGYLLPRLAIAELGRLTHTAITADRIELNHRGWVNLGGLTVRPRSADPYENALLQAQEVKVVFSWRSLWRRRPCLESIHLKKFRCNLLYDPLEKTWNTRGVIIPSGNIPLRLPQVHLEHGTLRYLRVSERKAQRILSVPFGLTLSPIPDRPQTLAIDIETGSIAEGFGGSQLKGHWQSGQIRLQGGISDHDLQGIKRTWSIPDVNLALTYDSEGHCDLGLHFLQAQAVHTEDTLALDWLTPLLSNTSGMFTRLQGFINRYRPDGRINLDLAVHADLKALAQTEIQATVACQDVSIHDRKFPYLLDHLQGDVHITHKGLTGKGMTGRHGDAHIELDFSTLGFGGDWQYDVRMASDSIPLDQDLYLAIPPHYQVMWDQLNPKGSVWIDNRLTYRSPTDSKRVLHVRPLGINAAYRGFPYPLEAVAGDLRFEPQGATLTQLTARRADSVIVLNGTVGTAADQPVAVEVQVEARAIPFDETLAQAMPSSQREAYRKLKLRGATNAQIHITNTNDPNSPPSYHADLHANDVSLSVPQWQSDLTDVNIRATLNPQALVLHSLTGLSGRSPVSIQGPIQFASSAAPASYALSIQSEQFYIADLIAGLSQPTRGLVQSLHATGALKLEGRMESQQGLADPNFQFLLHCQNNAARPQAWPYPLRTINGTLRLKRHSLVIDQLSAIPDVNDGPSQARLQLSGTLGLNAGQCDRAHLTLAASTIGLNSQLVNALPAPWRASLDSFGVDGALTIRPSQLTFTVQHGQPHLTFQGGMSLKDCHMTLFGVPADVNAVADIQLSHQAGQGIQEGRVALEMDPIRIQGKAVRRLETTLAYHPENATWGTEQFTGDFYGGRLMGDFHLHWMPGTAPVLQARLGFSHANLQAFLKDGRPTGPDIGEPSRGILAGSVSLGLLREEGRAFIGHCQLSIDDMEVGARSPLAKVLGSLRGHARDDIHFDRMFINAYIQNEKIHLQRFDISGRSLALQGVGSLNVKSNLIDLNLVTRGIRHPTSDPKVLQSLSEGLGKAVIRMKVTGDPMQPVVTTRTLPVLEDSLRIFGATD